jgi:hypothetical protein
MQAKKVAGRQGPGPGLSGEMGPKTRIAAIAATAAANALFIFSTFKTPTAKIASPKLNRTRIRSKRLDVLPGAR